MGSLCDFGIELVSYGCIFVINDFVYFKSGNFQNVAFAPRVRHAVQARLCSLEEFSKDEGSSKSSTMLGGGSYFL